MAKKQEKKQCFVVGPIGDDDSEDRIHADWLLEEIILPVFSEHYADFEVTRADKVASPGQITSQVITSLLEADLVIADLTELNPNAFYEIGIRHVLQKPIIHMHLEGQRIPFDIAPFRSIKFSRRRPTDIRAAREQLTRFLTEALDPEHQVDNPVTFARGRIEFDKNATPVEKLMREELEAVKGRLTELENVRGRERIVEALQNNMRRGPRIRERLRRHIVSVENKSTHSLADFKSTVEAVAATHLSSYSVHPDEKLGAKGMRVLVDYETEEERESVEDFLSALAKHGYAPTLLPRSAENFELRQLENR